MIKTMKKSLAIILSLAVCFGLLCVPASASDSTSANDFPYMLFDFEDGKSITAAEGISTVVEGGMGGSGHALQLTTTAGATGDFVLQDKGTGAFNGTIPAGSTLRISFWMKLTSAVSSGTFGLINYPLGGQFASAAIENPSSTDWQKVTFNYTATEEKTFGYVYFRPAVGQTFLIDDFEAMILPASVVGKADQITNLDDYYASYEGDVAPFGIYQAGYWNATKTERNNGELTSQIVANPDGDGQVVKIVMGDKSKGNGADFFLAGNTNTNTYDALKAPVGTIAVGSTATIRFKYYLETELTETTTFGFSAAIKDTYLFNGTGFDSTPNQWHTATLSYTNNTESAIELVSGTGNPVKMRPLANYNVPTYTWVAEGNAGWDTTGSNNHNFGERTIYFDDMEMFITAEGETIPAAVTPAKSENLVVTGNVKEGNSITFAHTFTAASTSAEDVTDKSVVRLVNYKANGEKAVIDYCGINETMTVPATPADSAKMMFEVVPIGSDGTVGKVAEYAVPEAEDDTITETALSQESGVVTVSAAEAINNAYIIFVSYDANGRMVDYDMASVTLSAQQSYGYSPVDFTTDNHTKAMLWADLDDCVPLATAIQY